MNDILSATLKALRSSKLSSYKIAQDTGISDQTIINYRNGTTIPRGINLKTLSKYLGINKDGVLETVPARKGKVIRFWENIEATGGGIMSFDDTLDGNYSEMVLPDFTDCTDAIRLVGDSMYPRYKSGQVLVFKEWRESFVEFGQVYLIITRTGYRMVKYLQPSSESGKLICVSENKEQFPPFSIEIESIYRLYLIKGSVEQNTY